MKMVRVCFLIIAILFACAVYLTISLFWEVPMPSFYEKVQSDYVESYMKNDPFMKLSNTTIKLIKERDSLLIVVDSLKNK